MIKIEIQGETWEDVQLQMRALGVVKPGQTINVKSIDDIKIEEVEDDGFVTVHPEPEPAKEEKPKQKRKRRTKAEIEADEAGDSDDPREECRNLLKNIEAKHKAGGLVKASGAIKEILDDQGGEYDKPKMSNVDDASLPALVKKLEVILEGGE